MPLFYNIFCLSPSQYGLTYPFLWYVSCLSCLSKNIKDRSLCVGLQCSECSPKESSPVPIVYRTGGFTPRNMQYYKIWGQGLFFLPIKLKRADVKGKVVRENKNLRRQSIEKIWKCIPLNPTVPRVFWKVQFRNTCRRDSEIGKTGFMW